MGGRGAGGESRDWIGEVVEMEVVMVVLGAGYGRCWT